MTRSLSPLILPSQHGNAFVTLSGAEAAAEAGISNAQSGGISLKLSPLGLPGLYKSVAETSVANLVGGQVSAEAGIVTVSTPSAGQVGQLGPLILSGPIRTINPFVGSVDVFPIGAEARAEAEELEGADATIYIDGAEAFAFAGISQIPPRLVVDEGVHSLSFTSVGRRIDVSESGGIAVISFSASTLVINPSSRDIIFSSVGRNISIIGANKTIDIE